MLAFGGVADGFVPFDAQTEDGKGEGQQVELQMASIVMKAVQVHLLHVPMHRYTLILSLMIVQCGLSQA